MKFSIALLVATVVFSVLLFTTQKDLQRVDLIANVWQMLVLGYAAIKLFLFESRGGQGRLIARTSSIIGLACIVWGAGHFLITYSEIVLQKTAYGTIADAFYVIGNGVSIYAGVSLLHSSLPRKSPAAKTRILWGVCCAIILLLFIAMAPLLQDASRHWTWKALDVLYPAMDFVMMVLFLLSAYQSPPDLKAFGNLVAVNFFLFGVGDMLFSYNTNFESLLYRLVDSLYSAAYIFLPLAVDQAEKIERAQELASV